MIFNKRLATESASQILADLRVSNERMSNHLEDELALEVKLTVELDKVRQRIGLAKKQVEEFKVKELKIDEERRDLEEEYYRRYDFVKKLSHDVTNLQNEMTKGKRMQHDLSTSLDRSRAHYLRTENELKTALKDLNELQQEALAVARRPISRQVQTDVDVQAIRDLDLILSDCQKQRKTISRMRASLTALTQNNPTP